MKHLCSKLCTWCEKLEFLPPLIARISVGWVFAESGWGKLHDLPKVVEFFQSLGIPAAQLQAPMVAGVELIGGVMLILGLGTCFASVPLIVTMIVAILTAKREDMSSLSDLFSFSEYLYIVLMLWLLISGPGKVSLDRWLGKKFCTDTSHG